MAPLKVTLPARSPAHTVRLAEPTKPVDVPHHHKVLAGQPAFAALCDTSVPTVRHWITQGMPAIRGGAAGGRLLIPVRLAQQWLESQAVSLAPDVAADDGEEVLPC